MFVFAFCKYLLLIYCLFSLFLFIPMIKPKTIKSTYSHLHVWSNQYAHIHILVHVHHSVHVLYMYIADLEDDATLTADDDDTSERAESPVLTPQGRGYQPAIDLTRFQKLIESEDKPSSSDGGAEDYKRLHHHTQREKHRRKGHSNRPSGQSTNEEHQPVAHLDVQRQTDMPTTQSSSNRHRHHGSTFGWSRDQQSARLAHVEEVGRQDIQEGNESSSETGMSELSSIPPEIDSRVNTTVDSETSSLHSHVNVSPSDQPAQPSGAYGERASVRDRGVELGERERLVLSQAPSMPQHPLHIAHRMASVHRREKEDGNADDRKHQVHGQLNTLEQVHVRGISM